MIVSHCRWENLFTALSLKGVTTSRCLLNTAEWGWIAFNPILLVEHLTETLFNEFIWLGIPDFSRDNGNDLHTKTKLRVDMFTGSDKSKELLTCTLLLSHGLQNFRILHFYSTEVDNCIWPRNQAWAASDQHGSSSKELCLSCKQPHGPLSFLNWLIAATFAVVVPASISR